MYVIQSKSEVYYFANYYGGGGGWLLGEKMKTEGFRNKIKKKGKEKKGEKRLKNASFRVKNSKMYNIYALDLNIQNLKSFEKS